MALYCEMNDDNERYKLGQFPRDINVSIKSLKLVIK